VADICGEVTPSWRHSAASLTELAPQRRHIRIEPLSHQTTGWTGPRFGVIPESVDSIRQEVYDLPDQRLVISVALVRERAERLDLPMNDWEKKFAESVVQGYRTYGEISWKQRKHLRQILIKATEILAHRAEFDVEMNKAIEVADG